MMKLHYKTSTSALPNAGSRRGDANPSRAGLAACTSPKVGGRKANNSHTGVSPTFAPKEEERRRAPRATLGSAGNGLRSLQTHDIKTYLPTHHADEEIDGKRTLGNGPSLPILCFCAHRAEGKLTIRLHHI